MNRTILLGLAGLALALPVSAATPEATIKARQGNFKAIGKAFKAINDTLKSDAPDLAAVRAEAAAIQRLSGKLPGWFPKGTGKSSGVKTEAGPAIWAKPKEFRAAAARLNAASRALGAAAAGGDLGEVRPAAGALGAACKGCHEQFRVKD